MRVTPTTVTTVTACRRGILPTPTSPPEVKVTPTTSPREVNGGSDVENGVTNSFPYRPSTLTGHLHTVTGDPGSVTLRATRGRPPDTSVSVRASPTEKVATRVRPGGDPVIVTVGSPTGCVSVTYVRTQRATGDASGP